MNQTREHRIRNKILYGLRGEFTYQRLGELFNLSRQRVHYIIKNYRAPIQYESPIEKPIQAPPEPKKEIPSTNCFSCKKRVKLWDTVTRSWKFNFCRPCFDRYFTRKSGGELQGVDINREIVRIRDNHTCQNCLKVWVHGQRRFDVHHLNGNCGKMTYSYDGGDTIDGLITLCHRCHMNTPEAKEKMETKTGNVKIYFPKAYARRFGNAS